MNVKITLLQIRIVISDGNAKNVISTIAKDAGILSVILNAHLDTILSEGKGQAYLYVIFVLRT